MEGQEDDSAHSGLLPSPGVSGVLAVYPRRILFAVPVVGRESPRPGCPAATDAFNRVTTSLASRRHRRLQQSHHVPGCPAATDAFNRVTTSLCPAATDAFNRVTMSRGVPPPPTPSTRAMTSNAKSDEDGQRVSHGLRHPDHHPREPRSHLGPLDRRGGVSALELDGHEHRGRHRRGADAQAQGADGARARLQAAGSRSSSPDGR